MEVLKGMALDGWWKSSKEHQDDDLLVMLDADATYDPKDIPAFVEELTDYEVVWGSRLRGKIENGAMSTTNRIGNMILVWPLVFSSSGEPLIFARDIGVLGWAS